MTVLSTVSALEKDNERLGVIPIYSEEWVSKHLFGKDKKTLLSPAAGGQKKLWIQPKNKKNRLQNRLCSQVL